MPQHPWKDLEEHAILNAIEQETGLRLTNLCLQRNSYINRVFELEDHNHQRYIVKFYRPGRWTLNMIRDEHTILTQLRDLDIPVIPPLSFHTKTLFSFKDIPFTIFPKKGGRPLDELTPSRWEEVGRLLGRLHRFTSSQKKNSRLRWTPQTATQHHVSQLLTSTCIPQDFQPAFERATSTFITRTLPLFDKEPEILLHGDCHLGNIIFRPEEGLYLVDFDDMAIGSPIQDVWMLLPSTPDQCQTELHWFSQGYDTFHDASKLHFHLIPALKIMRQIHFAAWCAIQHQDPSFPHHFPEWGSNAYWSQLIRDIQSPLT